MPHRFDVGPYVDRFRRALSAHHLRYTDERRLLLHQFLLLTDKPVTLDKLERALITKYGATGSVKKLGLSGRSVPQSMNVLLACGLAKEIEPEMPEYCSTCLHPGHITMGTKRWRCWHCGASRRLQPRFVPINGARIRVDENCDIWLLGPTNMWSKIPLSRAA
jgi:ribosomal protein L37AE/L43A